MELNKENLYNEYIIKNLSRTECSKIFDCSDSLIQKRLKISKIKRNSIEFLSSIKHRGI